MEQLLLRHQVERGMAILLIYAMIPFYVPVKIAPEEPVAPLLHRVLEEQNAIRVVVIIFLSIERERKVWLVNACCQCRTPAAEGRRNDTLCSKLLELLGIGGHPRGCSRLPVYGHDRRMYVVLDVLVVEFQVKYAIVHAQFRVIDILRFQVDIALFVVILVVVTHAVVQFGMTGGLPCC